MALVVPAGLFAHTMLTSDVPYVRGYEQAVNYVVANAPPGSTVLFSGYRDGNFISGVLRMRRNRRDLTVLRADKLLTASSR